MEKEQMKKNYELKVKIINTIISSQKDIEGFVEVKELWNSISQGKIETEYDDFLNIVYDSTNLLEIKNKETEKGTTYFVRIKNSQSKRNTNNDTFKANSKTLSQYKKGDIVRGKITEIKERSVRLDVDGVDCVIPLHELTKMSLSSVYEVLSEASKGKTLKIEILGINQKIGFLHGRCRSTLNNKKSTNTNARKTIEFSKGDYVTGTITKVSSKSVIVNVDGIQCHIPKQEISDDPSNDVFSVFNENDYGKSVTCLVVAINKNTNNALLSYKRVKSPIWDELKKTYNDNKISAVVCDVTNDSIYVTVHDDVRGRLLFSTYNEKAKHSLKKGDLLEVVLHNYNKTDDIIEFAIDPFYYTYYKESGDVELRKIRQNEILDAKVTEVAHNKVKVCILDTDIVGEVGKYKLSPNRTIDATEEVFPGEYLQLVFCGINRGKFLFERKSLLEDVYKPELYDESLEQILATMGIFTNQFKGCLRNRGNKWFLVNVIASAEKDSQSFGKLLVDPIRGIYPEVLVTNEDLLQDYMVGKYFEFALFLSDKLLRKRLGSPYLFTTEGGSLFETSNPYKEFVSSDYKKNDDPSSSAILAHLLEEVGQNLYSSKKRMFFELLQNADDSAPEIGTNVKIQICNNYFVITHNGFAFNKNDFNSIVSAAQSTKSMQANKTGYKGIGFKSVFTNSQYVKICSRGFSFVFNKQYNGFQSFEKYYFYIRDIEDNIVEQSKFLQKYEKEYNDFLELNEHDRIKVIPWQLKPIWEKDRLIQEDSIFNNASNVAIALNMPPETLGEYKEAVEDVFNEPRFMLFLRNTKRVQFVNGINLSTIQKNYSRKNNIVTLVNSSVSESKEDCYKMFTIENFVINNDNFAKAGIPIKKVERTNDKGKKQDYFVRIDENGNELSIINGIPDRIASSTSIVISFALKLGENKKIEQIKKQGNSFYAYLPMNESHFSFPFYVNADFIPKSDREGLQTDNPWNHYLFYAIGKCIVEMVASAASINESEYLTLLPSKELSEKETETRSLSAAFNKGYIEAIKSNAFIINDLGKKSFVSDICYDASGFSAMVGTSCFYALTGTEKKLPNTCLNTDILKHKIFGIEQFTTDDIVNLIIQNTETIKGFLEDDTSRTLFYNWVASDEKITTKLIDKIPLLKIGDTWVKRDCAYLRDNKIITTTKLSFIKNELVKLGFECTEYVFENHPLYKNIQKQTEKKVFEAIIKKDPSVLTFEERLAVFNIARTLDKVTEDELKGWSIFRNGLVEFSPMSRLCAYKEDAPIWLLPYMIAKDESNAEIQKLLVPADKVYIQIIKKYIDSILANTRPVEVYNLYPEWESTFTQKLIAKDIDRELLLPLVEQSDSVTKEKFLKSIKTLAIKSSEENNSTSFIYKILQLTVNCESALSHIRSIITIDDRVLNENTLSDTFHVNNNNVSYAFTLSSVLPFLTQSSLSSKVINSFSSISGYNKIFGEKELAASSVKDKLIEYLSKNSVLLNTAQFSFLSVYYSSLNYSCLRNDIRKYININDQNLILSIFEYSMSNGFGKSIGAFIETPGISRPYETIKDKFIGCDNITLAEERVPAFISNWATTDERKVFLSGIGVKDNNSKEIYRRCSFLEKKNETDIWSLNQSQKQVFFKWLVSENNITLPLNDQNQINILQLLGSKKEIYEEDLTEGVEWTNEKYCNWKQSSSLRIFLHKSKFPVRGKYDQTILYHTATTCDYVFFSENNRLYISVDSDIQSVLSQVISNSKIPFTKDDWNSLFLVSVTELEELKRQNELLIEELARAKAQHDGKDSEVDEHGRYTESDNTDPEARKQINKEARFAAYHYLSSLENYDCSEWDPEDSSHIIKNQIKYKGHYITVAVTSSRGRKLYLHPWVFAEIMESPENLLLNYGYDNCIHALSFSDVFIDNPNVNLIFDTDVVSPKEIANLANKYRSSKKTCFVIENPKYSQSEAIQSFGLNEKKEDGYVSLDFSDEDIFGGF